jgi:hypothetical protein
VLKAAIVRLMRARHHRLQRSVLIAEVKSGMAPEVPSLVHVRRAIEELVAED